MGSWEVSRFSVTESEARLSRLSLGRRAVHAGDYTRLTCKGEVIMSDTPAEMRDHSCAVRMAKGHVLINGLGIGMVLLNCMLKEEVERATVVELSQDVIDLVAPTYKAMFGERIEIVHADAMTYAPPKNFKYGAVWHDIWPTISADNYPDMKYLHRRYGRRCEWQWSWCREEVERLVRQEREDEKERRFFMAPIGGDIDVDAMVEKLNGYGI